MMNFAFLQVLLLLPGILYENPQRGVVHPYKSGKAIRLLPQVGYIVVNSFDENRLDFFDLNGKFVREMKLEMRPDEIFEADGKIFLNSIIIRNDQDIEHELWTYSSELKLIRKVKDVGLYSPVQLNGHWYGYDLFDFIHSKHKYPNMARQFDPNTSTYGEDGFLKMPTLYRKRGMHYKEFWVYPHGTSRVVLMSWSSNVYLLDETYLVRERLDGPSIATPIPKSAPLLIPGGFQNAFDFNEDLDILGAREVLRKHSSWLEGQTHITASWQNLDGIVFVVTTISRNESVLFYLTPSLEAKFIKRVSGYVLGGIGQRYWLRTDTEIGIEVNSYLLKER